MLAVVLAGRPRSTATTTRITAAAISGPRLLGEASVTAVGHGSIL